VYRNLEAEMTRYGLSVKDLAECINVNEKTMRSYLSGASKIAWEDARKIKHKHFPQFEIEYLFFYEREEIAS
jgi:plasmid maintenance system antidote protein VapI